MHCKRKLRYLHEYLPDGVVIAPLISRILVRTGMLQRLLIALCLYYLGAVSWLV